jgi:hypothetical protein
MPCVAQTGSPKSRGSITPQSRSPVAWAAGLVMGLLAVAGWGAFAYGIADQQRLSEQAADLRASREQLAEVYVKALEQLAAAQNEVVMLRSQVARLQSQPVSPTQVVAPQPAVSVTRTPPAPVPSPKKSPAASAGGQAGAPPPIPPFLRVFLPQPPRA